MHRFIIGSERISRVPWCFVSVLMCALLLGNTTAHAQEKKATASAIDEKAMAPVMRMAEFLAKAQSYSVTSDIGYDVDQAWGQKLEFGATRNITVRRPDRMAIDITDRDGTRRGFRFDGKQIAFFGLNEKVYATAQKEGDLDAAFAYFTRDLNMPLPMAELFSNTLPKTIKDKVSEAHYVEEATIAGTSCDHIALRNDLVDIQLWIAKGEKPLPERLVLTYKLEDGDPQFWANFRDWNFAPDTPDSLFAFTPPEGAARIVFVTGQDSDGGKDQ
jgi:hypothetical protein